MSVAHPAASQAGCFCALLLCLLSVQARESDEVGAALLKHFPNPALMNLQGTEANSETRARC